MSRYNISSRKEVLNVGDRSVVVDRLEVMKKQECTSYHIDDYFKRDPPAAPSDVDALCRYKMAQWCFTLVDALKLDRETVCIAISYLDRFLATGSPRARRVAKDRAEYQLASMTALYMAIKVFEPLIISAANLSVLSKGCYKSADITSMESDMLFDLNWQVNGPTASAFLEYFIALLPPLEGQNNGIDYPSIISDAKYQIELSATEYIFAAQHPSTIAIAAIVNSVERSTFKQKALQRRIFKEVELITGVDPKSLNIYEIAKDMNKLQNSPAFQERSHKLQARNIASKYHDMKQKYSQVGGDRISPNSCV